MMVMNDYFLKCWWEDFFFRVFGFKVRNEVCEEDVKLDIMLLE